MLGKIISPILGSSRISSPVNSSVVSEKNWIQGALKKRKTSSGPRGKGTLTAQAKSHGMTPGEFCASPAGHKGIAAKRCNMRKNLMK